jgi:hypothetical protein
MTETFMMSKKDDRTLASESKQATHSRHPRKIGLNTAPEGIHDSTPYPTSTADTPNLNLITEQEIQSHLARNTVSFSGSIQPISLPSILNRY